MQNDKKGTLLMLDSSLRDLPSPITPRPSSAAPVQAPQGDKTGPEQGDKIGRAKGAKLGREEGDKAGADKGHKKGKQAKHRAKVEEDLSRISLGLRELRGRVSDLHALHLDREGRAAGLAARMDNFGAEQAMARELTGALGARVDALGAKVDALRAEASVITDTLADLAVQPDRDTALFALEDRIQEAEETLVGLRALAEQQQMNETPDALAERLDGLGQQLVPLADRLAALEDQTARDGIGGTALSLLEQGLGTLSGSVDERTGAIERDLSTLRDQNKRWREAERAWAEERLNGVRQGLIGGIGLLALLLLAGFVATWWHGERQLDLIAARISAVEKDAAGRLVALAAPSAPADDRLGSALSELGAAMQGIHATNAELGARLTALSAAGPQSASAPVPVSDGPTMADLLMRLRALEEGRVGGVTAGDVPVRPKPDTRSETPAEIGPASPEQSRSEAAGPLTDAPHTEAASGGAQGLSGDPGLSEGPQGELAPAADAIPHPAVRAAAPAPVAVVEQPVDAVPSPAPMDASAEAAEPPAASAAVPAERFALQLIGFRTQASVAAFVREHGIAGEARWMRTPGRARDWYLVLLGDYASRQEAQEALAGLPEGLRDLSPMVRNLPAEAQALTPE